MLEKKPPAVGNFSLPNYEKKPPAVGNSSPPNSEKFAKQSMKAAGLAVTKDKPLEKFANKSIKAAGLADTRGKPLKPKPEKMGISTKAHSTDKGFIAETTTVSSAEQLAAGTTPLQDVIKAQTLSNATASRSSQTSEIGSKTLKIVQNRTKSR